MYVDDKAQFGTELAEFRHAGFGMMTEAKVLSFMQAANAECIHENTAHKLFGRKTGQRCEFSVSSKNFCVSGAALLPSALTFQMGPPGPGAKTITPLRPQLPPRGMAAGASTCRFSPRAPIL